MMTDKVLKNSGYKEVKVNDLLFPNADKVFKKEIKDRKGRTKYYINAVKYDIVEKDFYNYVVFSKTYFGMISFRLFGISLPLTIEEIEQEIDKIWTRGDFGYDESQ